MYVEPSCVRRGRQGGLYCDGHVVDIPPVREEAPGGQGEAGTDARYIPCPRQQELGPCLAGRGEQMVSSLFDFTLLLTPQGCPSSLNCMYTLLQELRTGAPPNIFGFFKKTKTRKKPHPDTGSMWVSGQAEVQCEAYTSKFKEVHGQTSEPTSEDFDVEVAMLAGQGKKGGRLWVGDALVDPNTIPQLRDLRRGRTSDQPRVETRPRAYDCAFERFRVCSFSVLYASLHVFHCNVNDIAATQRRRSRKKGTGKGTGRPKRRRC